MSTLNNVALQFESRDYAPIPLNAKWVGKLLPKNSPTPGAYLLLQNSQVFYVGRSDACLRTRLLKHELRPLATHVVWEVTSSPMRAYHQECYWFHYYRATIINQIEPARPSSYSIIKSPFLDCTEKTCPPFVL